MVALTVIEDIVPTQMAAAQMRIDRVGALGAHPRKPSRSIWSWRATIWVILGFIGAITALLLVRNGDKEPMSQHSRKTISHLNIEYGNVSGHSLRMDAHVPDGLGPFAAAIIVHGGAWVTGDRDHTVQPLFQPLSDAGYAWFSISYRLANGIGSGATSLSGIAPTVMLGSAIDDVRTAIAYVKHHAAEYRVDVNRIALIGESAGAQLASVAALKPGPSGVVRAVVALYSPSDLVTMVGTSQDIPAWARHAVQGTPWRDTLLASLRDLSPITWVRKDAPPFLLIHGTADSLVPFEQSNVMCGKLRAVGGSCEVYPVEGGGHGIHWWEFLKLTAYKQHMIHRLQQELG